MFLQNCNHLLNHKLQMKMPSCPLESREYVLFEEVSGCSLYLKYMLQCPFNKNIFSQNMLEVHISYFNGMLYHVKRNAHVEGTTHFKEMHRPFQGNRLKCLNICWLKALVQQCQCQNDSYKLIGCLCFCIILWHSWKIIEKQNCQIHVPSP